ncbi:MAG: gliding motility-associated C-terminal domain-containing protein, partial [Saprospiraceae bacterium]|nr:gliding motility-associated C-terminal domain-containing protein [Saprospiraceae bacterium]
FLLINGTRYDQNNRAGYEIIKNGSYTGCDSIVAIDLEFRNLWVYVGEDQEIIRGDFACIEAQYGLEPVELVWLPYAPCSDSACTEPCFRVVEPITFSFIATDVSGCVLIDDIRITISNKNRVYAANVFSPDAAWPNNYFYLGCDQGVVNIRKFMIANRWGEIMYEVENILPNDPEAGWDGYFRGSVMNPDTYIYFAELERYDGSTFEHAGGFSLVR